MAKYSFGVDVGGTTIKMGLFDMEGNVLDKWEIKTRTEEGGVNILPDIAKAVNDKMAEKSIEKTDVAGVGIGVPGPVDAKGIVHKCVNLGWGVFNINDELGRLLELPVKGGNDANVAALGEMWKGGGQGFESIVVVTLGTGVGGGIIMDGEILTGAKGAAGEIGHIHVDDNETEVCGCGNKGCLEQYTSATGVVRLANRRLKDNTKPTCLKAGAVSAKDVWDAVKAGDEVAKEIPKPLLSAAAYPKREMYCWIISVKIIRLMFSMPAVTFGLPLLLWEMMREFMARLNWCWDSSGIHK